VYGSIEYLSPLKKEANRARDILRIPIRCIAERHQKKGYATEALKEVVNFSFSKTELKRLWSDADTRNEASRIVLEKCGFEQEGRIRQGKMVSSWCDYYIYGILKEDYQKLLRG